MRTRLLEAQAALAAAARAVDLAEQAVREALRDVEPDARIEDCPVCLCPPMRPAKACPCACHGPERDHG
jgi:hypothetical protein